MFLQSYALNSAWASVWCQKYNQVKTFHEWMVFPFRVTWSNWPEEKLTNKNNRNEIESKLDIVSTLRKTVINCSWSKISAVPLIEYQHRFPKKHTTTQLFNWLLGWLVDLILVALAFPDIPHSQRSFYSRGPSATDGNRSERFSYLTCTHTTVFILLCIFSLAEKIRRKSGRDHCHCPGMRNVNFRFLSVAQKRCVLAL